MKHTEMQVTISFLNGKTIKVVTNSEFGIETNPRGLMYVPLCSINDWYALIPYEKIGNVSIDLVTK